MSNLKRVNGIGAVKGLVWGTAIEPSTGNAQIVKTHNVGTNDRDKFINDNEFAHDMYDKQELDNYLPVEGNLILPLYFEGLETFLATMYGKYSGSALTDGNQHNFEFDPVLSGLFQSIAFDEGDEVKSLPSAVLKSMSMSYDGGFDLDFGYMADRISIAGNFTKPLGLTFKSDGIEKYKLLQTDIYLNDFDGADFQASDKICASQFDFTLTRDFQAQPHCAGNAYILEPEEIGVPMWDFTLTLPKKNAINQAYFGDFQDGTYKKMKIVMTGKSIAGTDNYSFTMYFPKVRISEPPVYDQESPVPATLNLSVMKALVVPTGLSKLVPYAEMVNTIDILTGYPDIV